MHNVQIFEVIDVLRYSVRLCNCIASSLGVRVFKITPQLAQPPPTGTTGTTGAHRLPPAQTALTNGPNSSPNLSKPLAGWSAADAPGTRRVAAANGMGTETDGPLVNGALSGREGLGAQAQASQSQSVAAGLNAVDEENKSPERRSRRGRL